MWLLIVREINCSRRANKPFLCFISSCVCYSAIIIPLITWPLTLVKPKHEVKYLGLLFNRKLNWKNHIAAKTIKTKKTIFDIKRYIRLNWGIDYRILKNLYTMIVEPIMLYGVVVWFKATFFKWCAVKLRRAQRLMTISICWAYRTVSTNAASIISNILPSIPSSNVNPSLKITLTHVQRNYNKMLT